jgi:hypothetical protein
VRISFDGALEQGGFRVPTCPAVGDLPEEGPGGEHLVIDSRGRVIVGSVEAVRLGSLPAVASPEWTPPAHAPTSSRRRWRQSGSRCEIGEISREGRHSVPLMPSELYVLDARKWQVGGRWKAELRVRRVLCSLGIFARGLLRRLTVCLVERMSTDRRLR